MISKKVYVIGGAPLGLALRTNLIEDGYYVTLIEAGNKLFSLAGTFNFYGIETENYYHFS